VNETQKIPWKRISVEAAAIVASILLAFAIDAWWEDRVGINVLIEHLTSFEDEIARNDEAIEIQLKRSDQKLVALDNVLSQLADDDKQSWPDSFQTDLGKSLIYDPSPAATSAYEDLVNSGNLRLIKNFRLRKEISEYIFYTNFLLESDSYETSYYLEMLLPLLNRYSVLSNLGWSQYDTIFDTTGNNVVKSFNPPFSIDVAGMRSQEFWNALFHWKTVLIDRRTLLTRLKEKGLNLRNALRAEIANLSR